MNESDKYYMAKDGQCPRCKSYDVKYVFSTKHNCASVYCFHCKDINMYFE